MTNINADLNTQNTTATLKVPITTTDGFKVLWRVSSQIQSDLEPQIQKLIFAKEMIIYADMGEAMIQDNAGDVISGLITLITEVISTFHKFNDNVSDIYNNMEVANG